MQPRDEHEHGLAARLQTLIGAGRNVADFVVLRDDAVRLLGTGHEIVLEIEYTLETRRDAGRTPSESLPVWEELRARAGESLDPAAPTAVAIRRRHLRRLRGCGRPGDLDVLVDLCRRSGSRLDLALALRDRALFAADGDPARDLAEASVLIEDANDPVSAVAARRIQVEVLLALGRHEPAAASRALGIAEELVRLDDSEDWAEFDQLPRPHVLLAEALLLTGRLPEAGRVARLAYALNVGPGVFDPARPLLVLARSEAVRSRADACETAHAALRQRLATFPADSHYVAQARRLVNDLRD